MTQGEGSDAVRAAVELDVVRAQAGDRTAFDRLVTSHREFVYRTCFHVVRDAEDALDATQEAFLKAFRHLDGFDRRTTFGGWMRRVATNCALDRLERRKREKAHAAALPEEDAMADARGELAGDALERAEAKDVVRRAIDALPPAQRAAVLLRDVEGLSYEEIANALGIAKGTVMSRIYYGRENLKEALGRILGRPAGATP
jgi:RNA polymerase sigma-70 factor (ECF subfamily)